MSYNRPTSHRHLCTSNQPPHNHRFPFLLCSRLFLLLTISLLPPTDTSGLFSAAVEGVWLNLEWCLVVVTFRSVCFLQSGETEVGKKWWNLYEGGCVWNNNFISIVVSSHWLNQFMSFKKNWHLKNIGFHCILFKVIMVVLLLLGKE